MGIVMSPEVFSTHGGDHPATGQLFVDGGKYVYFPGDTVLLTLNDPDLDKDSGVVETFSLITSPSDPAYDSIGIAGMPEEDGTPTGRIIDIKIDSSHEIPIVWLPNTGATPDCNLPAGERGIILDDGFTMQETGPDTGVFTGSFILPKYVCNGTGIEVLQGIDMKAVYYEQEDAAGTENIEFYTAFIISAHPFNITALQDFKLPYGTPQELGSVEIDQLVDHELGHKIFSVSDLAITGAIDTIEETVGDGTLKFYWDINNPNYNINPNEIDSISTTQFGEYGPVIISIKSGISDQHSNVLATAGGPTVAVEGKKITSGSTPNENTRQLGPIYETGPDTGIFRFSLDIKHTDGINHSSCAETMYYSFDGTLSSDKSSRFDVSSTDTSDYCIYSTPDFGNAQLIAGYTSVEHAGYVTEMRHSQSYGSESRIGFISHECTSCTTSRSIATGDEIVITLTIPALNRDIFVVETVTMDVINLQGYFSPAPKFAMGPLGLAKAGITGNPFNLSVLTETGVDTGIFQGTITIPTTPINGIELAGKEWGFVWRYFDDGDLLP